MTARHAQQRTRKGHLPRRVRCRACAVSLVVCTVLGARLGPAVAAAFVSHAGATTGTLSFARLTASFANGTDSLGAAAGTGGATFTTSVSSLALAGTAYRFTSLTNTGSVTAAISGTVSGSGTSGTMNVSVDACSVAWAAGLCTGTTTALLGATALSTAPTVSYGSLAVNGVRYLRYTFTATSLSATANVTATAVPTGTGTGNRTAG